MKDKLKGPYLELITILTLFLILSPMILNVRGFELSLRPREQTRRHPHPQPHVKRGWPSSIEESFHSLAMYNVDA